MALTQPRTLVRPSLSPEEPVLCAHMAADRQLPPLQNGVMSGLMQMLLLKVSAHITEQLGMAPGGEFREAFKEVGLGSAGKGAQRLGAARGSGFSSPHPASATGQQGAFLQVPPGRPAHPRHLQEGHRGAVLLAEGEAGLGPVLPVRPHQVGPLGLPQAAPPRKSGPGPAARPAPLFLG